MTILFDGATAWTVNLAVLSVAVIMPGGQYQQAKELLQNEDYAAAFAAFEKLGNDKDAEKLAQDAQANVSYPLSAEEIVSAFIVLFIENEVCNSMNRFLLALLTLSLVFCLSGCKNEKSESEYQSAVSQHMRNEHGSRVTSCQSFSIYDEGGASATVNVAVTLEGGIGSSVMVNDLILDKNGYVSVCDWCDLGIG